MGSLSFGGCTAAEGDDLRYNQISDIAPLVDNSGLGKGDKVNLYNNPLSDLAISTQIPALRERGVEVYLN